MSLITRDELASIKAAISEICNTGCEVNEEVLKGTCVTDATVVMKFSNKDNEIQPFVIKISRRSVAHEVKMLSKTCGKRNIVPLLVADVPGILVFPAFPSDLLYYIQTQYRTSRYECEIADIAQQLIRSVKDLHALGIAHRDIKLENFLVRHDADGRIVIVVTDLGSATDQGGCCLQHDKLWVSTPKYCSFEVFWYRFHDPMREWPTDALFSLDNWALKVTLFAVYRNCFPYDVEKLIEVARRLNDFTTVDMGDLFPGNDNLADFFSAEPEGVPDGKDISQHPILSLC